MEDETQTPPRRQFQNYRSTASNNWRVKDDSPRVDSQQQRGTQRERGERDSPRGGYRPSYDRRERSGEVPTEVTTPRLYVGNLLYTAQSADVETFFVENGFTVTNLTMSIDPMTGRNPSYCFVDLESVDEAKRAMQELNGRDILGRAVKINPGVSKKEGGSAPFRINGRSDGNGNDGENNYKPTYDRWNRTDTASQFNKPLEQGKRLYIGGLPRMEPQSAVDSEIQKLFSDLNVEITTVSKILSPHPSKASEPGDHYYLFVDLANEADADVAINALNDSASPWSQEGGKLKVNRAKDNTGRKVNREQGQGGGRGFGNNPWREATS